MFIEHRRGYQLKSNHCNALPRHIIAVDTETKPTPLDPTGTILAHNFFLGTAVTCRLNGTQPTCVKRYALHKQHDFLELLQLFTRGRQTTWVVAHNLLFDFITLGLPAAFERGELVLDWPRSKRKDEHNDSDSAHCHAFAVIESPPTIIGARVCSTQGRVVFVDTMNWFRCPLAEVAQELGLPKLPMPAWSAPKADWLQYCWRDTEIVYQAFVSLIQWNSQHNFGMFRYTAASQAWSAYRHRFMDRCIYPHDIPDVTALERSSFFGGRSECWRLGQIREPVYKVDVSSLYPSVMAANLFPGELSGYEKAQDYMALLPGDDLSDTIAEVMLRTDAPIFPKRTAGPTIYPSGTFTTVLAGPELEAAHSLGAIAGCRSYARYKMARLFDRWVAELWGMRLTHETAGEQIYAALTKLMLNSLPGKFAERSAEWQTDPNELVTRPWSRWVKHSFPTGETTSFRSFGWTAQRCVGTTEKHGRLVAISSYVAAYGRIRMNQLRHVAGQENCYYQGVDSLIVNHAGLARLQEAGEVFDRVLGRLRVLEHASSSQINGIGDYSIGDHHVVAGRSGYYREVEANVYEQRKFHGRERLFDGSAVPYLEEEVTRWQRTHNYSKGRVGADGYVLPFELDELGVGTSDGLSCPTNKACPSASA